MIDPLLNLKRQRELIIKAMADLINSCRFPKAIICARSKNFEEFEYEWTNPEAQEVYKEGEKQLHYIDIQIKRAEYDNQQLINRKLPKP